jgi:hypothetical protein
MDPYLKSQLRQTIYTASRTATSGAGVFTYGTPATKAARVEERASRVLNADGEEQTSSHQIIVDAADVIAITDRIWLPGDATTVQNARTPMSVAKAVAEDGTTDHWEIYV